MREYVNGKFMRTGYTTGACAAAAAGCAADILFGKVDDVKNMEYSITLPSSDKVSFCVTDITRGASYDAPWVRCGVKKDAGDDWDVTDGITVFAKVSIDKSKKESGIFITGGKGVGKVTREGLDMPVGEYAINSVPRQMITSEVIKAAKKRKADISDTLITVCIEVPGGEVIAKKTFNPRLGIEGGISIIGTSGIVHPMSQKALVDTIRTEIKMKIAEGESHIYFVPGNYGEEFAKKHLGIKDSVICSNFIGEALDIAVESGFENIVFIGHFGKLIKLYNGIMNTHSREADGRLEAMASACALSGGDIESVRKILLSNTTDEALVQVRNEKFFDDMLERISERIEEVLNRRGYGKAQIGAVLFSMNEREEDRIVCCTKNIRSWYRTRKHGGYDL